VLAAETGYSSVMHKDAGSDAQVFHQTWTLANKQSDHARSTLKDGQKSAQDSAIDTTAQQCVDEQELLQQFSATCREQKLDVLVGHALQASTLNVLAERIFVCSSRDERILLNHLGYIRPSFITMSERSSLTSSSSPMRLSQQHSFHGTPLRSSNSDNDGDRSSQYAMTRWQKSFTAGLLLCDMRTLCREHLDIPELDLVFAHTYLHAQTSTPHVGLSSRRECTRIATLTQAAAIVTPWSLRQRAVAQLEVLVDQRFLQLTAELSRCTGAPWQVCMQAGQSRRIEYLLLHASHALQLIPPDPISWEKRSAIYSDSKAGFTGGLVLEPQQKLYTRPVLLLDFQSLYPSIICEYGLCFHRWELESDRRTKNERITAAAAVDVPILLPAVLNRLLDLRARVKAQLHSHAAGTSSSPISVTASMGSSSELLPARLSSSQLDQKYLEIRERALKLTANSIYGCLGSRHFRFYSKRLAETITECGRRLLRALRDQLHTPTAGHEVIYGDTDSVMLEYTREHSCAEVLRQGKNFVNAYNRTHKHLRLKVDAVYAKLLLVSKKRYAGVRYTPGAAATTVHEIRAADDLYNVDIRGLLFSKHSICELAREHAISLLVQLLNAEWDDDDDMSSDQDIVKRTSSARSTSVAESLQRSEGVTRTMSSTHASLLTTTMQRGLDHLMSKDYPWHALIVRGKINQTLDSYPTKTTLEQVNIARRLHTYSEVGRRLRAFADVESTTPVAFPCYDWSDVVPYVVCTLYRVSDHQQPLSMHFTKSDDNLLYYHQYALGISELMEVDLNSSLVNSDTVYARQELSAFLGQNTPRSDNSFTDQVSVEPSLEWYEHQQLIRVYKELLSPLHRSDLLPVALTTFRNTGMIQHPTDQTTTDARYLPSVAYKKWSQVQRPSRCISDNQQTGVRSQKRARLERPAERTHNVVVFRFHRR